MKARSSAMIAVTTITLLLQGSINYIPGAEAKCFLTDEPGFPMAPYLDSSGTISCKPGFFCPGFDPLNATTYPEACLPSPLCAVERMWGRQCLDRQGTFEPFVCPVGSYCPVNQGTMLKCPSGSMCQVGSTEPQACGFLELCTGGTRVTYYGSFIIWLLASGVVFGVWAVYRKIGLGSVLVDARGNDGGRTTPGATAREASDQQLVEGFRRSRGNRPPLRLEFLNLAVSVKDSATGKTKNILKDMSGTMEPGTVTAIMGPSGAGKTTFMMALLGKKDPAWETKGKLLVNGEDQLSRMRHSIGFVPQDDVLHKELSIYKNLYYSSETRLPGTWTSEQKVEFRSAVVESLGLAKHRDTVIGDEFERGVSGGQRKRASIGVELCAAPLAVFLDEPTSGLDSTTSLEVCSTLKKIAVETDLTVGMVIHQPRVEIWNGLDQVLFIGKGGRVVYQGSQAAAKTFFETKCNVAFPAESNPADVIIDAVNDNSESLADLWVTHVESRSPTQGRKQPNGNGAGEDLSIADIAIPEPFNTSDSGFRGASFMRQLVLSHNRYMEKQLATMGALRVEMVVCVLCGLILGFSYAQFDVRGAYVFPYRRVSPIPLTALDPQLNMYKVMSLGLGAAPAGVRVFGLDRFSYYREVAAGASPLAYFLGTLFSVTYRCTYVTLLFCAAMFCLGALPINFGVYYSTMFFIYWNAYAIGMVVSQAVPQRMAPLVAQVVVTCLAIFNGFVAYPDFLKQMSFSFHASQIIMNEWYDITSQVFEPNFAEWSYRGGTVGESMGILFVISVISQVFAFVLMVGTNRDRQK